MSIAAAQAADDQAATPESAVIAALLAGAPTIHLRYRYEQVDDDAVPAKTGEASTLRTALGWKSGSWNGLSVYAEMENVTALGIDDYKSGPGPVDPGSARYPVIADPTGTELNQAYTRYTGYPGVALTVGRQELTHREAPSHRYIGNVLWRQNWQTFDAARLIATPLEGLTLDYAYAIEVNRIFGDDAPSPFDEFDCDCHLVDAQYTALADIKFETYAYLLDIDNARANSLNTYGARIWGTVPVGARFKLIYAGEYASQDDAAGNPLEVDADYYLGEAGLAMTLPWPVLPAVTVKFDYEELEGNGTTAFQTPLATGHAFQGWADRFLATPRDGIEDSYVTLVAPLAGGTLIASYHDLRANRLGYDYGDEFDIHYEHPFAKHWTAGAKAAFYAADRNARALARAGADQNNDVTKVWAWLQFDY